MSVKLPANFKGVHFHFVGIKGTGMAALVEICHTRGAIITGSDVSERFYTDEILEKLNITPKEFSKDNVTEQTDFVIYSSAYNPQKCPDLIKAAELNKPMMLYSQALGAVSETAYSCGICGVHGKTTTTGLTGTLLKNLPLESQVLAGSIIASFDNSCVMTKGHKYFVAETCEYQRHFMSFAPKKIILTSVESDHQDFYPTYNDIRDAFVDYICKLPQNGHLIYCADDKGAVETASIAKQKRSDIQLIPYGTTAKGDFNIVFGQVLDGKQHFNVTSLGDFKLCVPGEHNVRNATASLALVTCLLKEEGLDVKSNIENLKEGLLNFKGGKRRSEITCYGKTPCGQQVIFIDDYAHHPTAIKTTLEGYRKFYKKHKIIVDFMSHTYSRTQALLEEFATSFAEADEVIINKIYASAREDSSNATVTGEILSRCIQKYNNNTVYCEEFNQAAQKALELLSIDCSKQYEDGYIFVTMGAGDNWKVAKLVQDRL